MSTDPRSSDGKATNSGSDSPSPQPKIEIPKGGESSGYGETFGEVGPTGSLNWGVPVPVTPARGAEPALHLQYAQRNGNGAFGYGFDVAVQSFSRRTDVGVPEYAGRDSFLGHDGSQLVPAYEEKDGHWIPIRRTETLQALTYQVTQYRPRVESSFERIEFWESVQSDDSFWRVTDATSTVSEYGRSAESRIANPAAPAQVSQWLIESEVDAHGKATRYHYKLENDANVPTVLYERGHGPDCQRYLSKIEYGNWFDPANGEQRFGFQILFDYGEYDVDSGSALPVREWAYRPDPFSSFRFGFELRTKRRCAAILMVHQFPSLLDGGPVLVHALRLSYLLNGGISQIAKIAGQGFRHQADGTFETIAQPPIELTYCGLDLAGSVSGVLRAGTAQFDGTASSLVDLFGDGVPGVLSPEADAFRYWRPIGEARFEPSAVLPAIPTQHIPQPRVALMDISGESRLDMVVFGAASGGFYENNQNGSWQPFRQFESTTNLTVAPAAQFVDLDGDGLADVAVLAAEEIVSCRSMGASGFSGLATEVLPRGFPVALDPGSQAVEAFADMFGDGLQHRVRISSGSVEVWPSLGHGRFGERIALADAPRFRQSLTPGRILLSSLAGTGCADLILIYEFAAELYANQNGNRFLEPISIPLPCAVDNLDIVTLADLFGIGRPSIVVSKASEPVQNFYVRAGSEQPVLGLRRVDNNRGQRQSVQYRPAAHYSLADRAAGKPWMTRLPVPVIVVDQTITEDAVAGSTLTSTFQYRDGYFDPEEKTFTCFGSLQQQDTETFDPQVWRFPTATGPRLADAAPVEPQLSRTWSFTGAYREARADERDFFQGDPDAIEIPPVAFSAAIAQADGITIRQAHFALKGERIRQETYGVDESGSPHDAPYLVEENGAYVRMLQPCIDGHPAVFHLTNRETASSVYDQAADDPRIEHTVIVKEDRFGNAEQTATINYKRRTALGRIILPGQDVLRVICEVATVKNVEQPFYRLGIAYREQQFEIGNPHLAGRYFTFAELAAQVDEAFLHLIPFGQPFSSGLEARLFESNRTYFWNADRTAPLALGDFTREVLVHHSEDAVFPEVYPSDIYAGRVNPSMLAQDSRFHLDEGYWWTTGAITGYGGANSFYQPGSFTEAFQVGTNLTTVTEYDPYALAPIKVTDPLNFSVSATIDYQRMKARSITDPNGTVSEVLFDALGRVLVSAVHGHIDGAYAGNMELSGYQPRPRPANIQEVIGNAPYYIQGAGMYFFYGDAAWVNDRKPAHHLTLISDQFANDPNGSTPESHIRMGVVYVDGAGASVCDKTAVEASYTPEPPTSGLIWIVGSQADLDPRGNPVRRYAQYFSATPNFERPQMVPFFTFQYDAIDRVVRTGLPNGHFTETAYSSWNSIYSDENDTTPTRFDFDTPETTWFDNRGLTIQRTQINALPDLDVKVELNEFTWLDAAGNPVAQVDARFYNSADPLKPTRWNLQYKYDMLGNSLVVESVDAGNATPGKTYWLFTSANDLARNWDARGLETNTDYEVAIRRTANVVVTKDGSSTMRLRLEYGSTPASNDVNMTVKTIDEAGLSTAPSFDLLGNSLLITRRYATQYKQAVDWSDPLKVALEPKTWEMMPRHNALGEPAGQTLAEGTRLTYDRYRNGALRTVTALFPGDTNTRTIAALQYDANGQRCQIASDNSVTTSITYTPDLSRLDRIHSLHDGGQALLDLTYAYDPVGNVTGIANALEPPRIVRGQVVGADSAYQYDAIYRIHQATGRCQPGVTVSSCAAMPSVNDPQQIENYTRQYTYDRAGNMTLLRHEAQSSTWQLEFAVSPTSNHSVPAPMVDPDQYFDASGNLMQLETIPAMEYDERNLLRKAVVIARVDQPDDAEYYTYDAGGLRVRKVTERLAFGGTTLQRTDVLYIGDAAIAIVTTEPVADGNNSAKVIKQIDQVQVLADDLRVLVTSIESTDNSASRVFRYQLADAQKSVSVETDETGAITGYREYFPFGCASVEGGTWATDGSTPRYRYTGLEQDAATGFYSAELRYYVPWLCRWLTTDPAGPVDSLNLYQYTDNNPVTLSDPSGLNPDDALLLFHHLRYMDVAELDKALDVANAVFNEAYANKNLFVDESERFSASLEKRIVGLFGEFIGAFSSANKSLRDALLSGGATKSGGASGSDLRKKYQTLRTAVNKTLPVEFPHFDFSPESGQRPFELHHLLYKAQHPSLATTSTNFAMTTRGSGSSGLIGTHEGLFHLVTSGNDSSIYTREVAGVIGIIKRMIAANEGIDLATTNPTGAYSWLALKKGAPYSKPGTGKTKDFRAKSTRIQRQNALKRQTKTGISKPRFLRLKKLNKKQVEFYTKNPNLGKIVKQRLLKVKKNVKV